MEERNRVEKMERPRGGTKGRDRNRDRGKDTECQGYRQRGKETPVKRQRE
jgi:hypothetical protein